MVNIGVGDIFFSVCMALILIIGIVLAVWGYIDTRHIKW